MLSPEAEVWRQRDTPLKNRGMRIQTVQEKQRQEKRPLRTEVGNDLRNRGRRRCMPPGTEVEKDACPFQGQK
jgi:hypothetical protein